MNEKTPSTEAMKIVSDIRRIDAYGDSAIINCLTYSEAAQLIENYGAAQRQAGREEMSSAEYVLRLISEPDPWYRDMNPKKQVELIRDRARKALDDLDEARKGCE